MINDHSSKIFSSRIFQIAKKYFTNIYALVFFFHKICSSNKFSSLSFAVSIENFDTFLNHI